MHPSCRRDPEAQLPTGSATTGRWLRVLLLGLAVSLAACAGRARDNYEIQVYGSETVAPGRLMVETHSNVTLEGNRRTIHGVYPSYHALHETLELTYGFNDWLESGFYVFTSVQPGHGWEWVGNHIRPRVRIPEAWDWPVGLSLSTELGYQRRVFAEDTWSWEVRPIADKRWGPWSVALNPAFEKSLHGRNAADGYEFAPSGRAAFEVSRKLTLGVEYYAGLGTLERFRPWHEQEHMIMPAVDIEFTPDWEFSFGVGFGLTRSTDDLLLKLILGRRF